MTSRHGDGGATQAGGTSTARVPTTNDPEELARRAEVHQAAAQYLTRTGNADLLPILGLDGAVGGVRRCERCGDCIVSVKARTKYCSKECSATAASQHPRKRATAT